MVFPKYQIGQQVKFINDHDRMTGVVLSFSYHSANVADDHSGWVYTISSRYYDAELHDMVKGVKICREEELVDMSDYKGTTDPAIPDKTVNVSDHVSTDPAKE